MASAAGSSSEHGVAVCVAGSLRTFFSPDVQRSFRDSLHHAGYEYFVSTDLALPAERRRDVLFGPIRAWIANGDTSYLDIGRPNTPQRDELPRGRCPRGTCNPNRYLLPAMRRLAECYYSMQKEEARRSARYSAVLRLRPDHVLLKRLPPVSPVAGWMGQPLVPGRVLLWDDQFAVARRDEAAAILLAPSVAYATCADDAQWARAVARLGRPPPPDWTISACRQTGAIPVTAMALAAVVFGSATSWLELDLEARGWRPQVGPARPATEQFCLKRSRARPNETMRQDQSTGIFFDGVGMSC